MSLLSSPSFLIIAKDSIREEVASRDSGESNSAILLDPPFCCGVTEEVDGNNALI